MATERIFRIDHLKLEIQKSNPPQLALICLGVTNTGGWKNIRLIPCFNPLSAVTGIYEYDFVGDGPEGNVTKVLTPTTADTTILHIPPGLKCIVVYSKTNKMEQAFPPFSHAAIAAPSTKVAKGFSDSFSFDAAFKDAVGKLTIDPLPYPDYLQTIRVTNVGAEIGGLSGGKRMFVEIESN